MNAIIKYFGGKGCMYKQILQHFPSPGTYNTYIEPFGGAYNIGLRAAGNIPIEIYNDLEQNVYSLYKVLSDKELFKKFKKKCDQIYYLSDLRLEAKHKLLEKLSIVDRAFYYFYFNRLSHNGVGGFSINTSIRRNMSKSVSDILSSIDRLPELHDRLAKVIVTNMDGISLLKKYSLPGVFFYCDPPYEQSTRTSTRYKTDMDRKQHIEFLNACINSNAMLLISGYDCDLYSILTKNQFTKIQFTVNTISGNKQPKTKTETLWKNY